MKQASNRNGLSTAESLIHIVSFIALSCAALPFFFFTPSFEGSYGAVFQLAVAVLYALLLASLAVTLIGKSSLLLLNTLRALAGIVALAPSYIYHSDLYKTL